MFKTFREFKNVIVNVIFAIMTFLNHLPILESVGMKLFLLF